MGRQNDRNLRGRKTQITQVRQNAVRLRFTRSKAIHGVFHETFPPVLSASFLGSGQAFVFAHIFLRRFVKLLPAIGTAEKVVLTLKSAAVLCSFFIDFHATNWIDSHKLQPSLLVFSGVSIV